MEIKERKLKGYIGISYLVLSIVLFLSVIKIHCNMLSYIGFACLGLSMRAFVFVYKKWNEPDKLKDKVARGCIIDYLFYYPLLIGVIFILAYTLNDKYNIAKSNFLMLSVLSFYIGFDIVRATDKFS